MKKKFAKVSNSEYGAETQFLNLLEAFDLHFLRKKMKKNGFFLEKSHYLLPVGGKNYYDYKNKYRNYKYHFIVI